MWQRIALVFMYLLSVILAALCFEFGLWFTTGFSSYDVFEPLQNLSVSNLKLLLDLKGIGYLSILEKPEIVDLLRETGPVYYSELLYALSSKIKMPHEISGRTEFFNKVYDSTETIWLIEILPADGKYSGMHLITEDTWKILGTKLQFLRISTAVFNCHYDEVFCEHRGWANPQLLLILPSKQQDSSHSSLGKKEVYYHSSSSVSASAVLKWISSHVLSVTETLKDPNLMKMRISRTRLGKNQIPQMIYISRLINPPLLLAAIGLTFSSRVKFSVFSVSSENEEEVKNILIRNKLKEIPSLVVVKYNSITSYGSCRGETLTSIALETYIHMLQPRTNNMFILSVVIANLLAIVDILIIRNTIFKHILRVLLRILFYNVLVFLMWLAFTSVMNFPWITTLVDDIVTFIHDITDTYIAKTFFYHILLIELHPVLCVGALLLFAIFCVVYVFVRPPAIESQGTEADWWAVFPMDSYLLNVLFRPMVSLSRPRLSQDVDFEEGMELLIERLVTPNLWLQPVVPTDYIKDLPLWRYDGWGNEDDLRTESETDFDSLSDNENEVLLQTHSCCEDSSCHVCELWSSLKEVYLCHRCAFLKRKLERHFHRHRRSGRTACQQVVYEKLVAVCDNCSRIRKHQSQNDLVRNTQDSHRENWLSPQHFISLKWTAPDYTIESRICAICLGRYRWSVVLCALPCGHNYHHACITEWLFKDNHHCPTCRWPSYKHKTHSRVPVHSHTD